MSAEEKKLEDVIDLLTQLHELAPPFICLGEDQKYYIRGISDLANGEMQDYGKYGKCKLTALNHSATLTELMNFNKIIAKLEDENLLDYNDEEIVRYLEIEFLSVLQTFLNNETVEYSNVLAYSFAYWNKQLINESIYNLTRDENIQFPVSPQQLDDSLEGEQFIDPYITIAYEIAYVYKIRPYTVINEWSTSELVVTFAKMANDNSLTAFTNYKYSQPKAPKQRPPQKQMFYFGDVSDEGDDDSNE